MTIAGCFLKLLSRIRPLPSEVAQALKHASSIKARLGNSFRLRKFLLVGSHARQTAIRWFSDVDFFGVFSRDDFRWGDGYKNTNSVLDNLRTDLASRFWQTPVYRDGPAVVVSFGGGDYAVDVVPAMFWEMNAANWPIYYIPDGGGGWMRTSPELHNKFIRDADTRSGGKLKRTVQLVKYWRECRTPRVPISSFHLDLLVADKGMCTGVKSYAQCLVEVFQLLARRECRAYQDPLKVSGYVNAVRMGAQREAALQAVDYACEHAAKALEAERRGNQPEACRQWSIVFNGAFPT
jgi:hypothetical protein